MSFGTVASIGEPTTLNDKFGKFTSYKVTSESTKSGFRPGRFDVDRRYSDFVWLQAELSRELPGCILPPLPEKQTLGRLMANFVDARRRSLERYLSRIIAHPELSSSHILVIFLQNDEASFNRAKEESKASRPKLASTAVSWFEGKVNTMAYGKAAIDRSPADIKIEEMGEYVAKLEKQLSTIAKNSEVLVKRWKDTSAAASELALSLIGFEGSDAESKSTEASKLGTAVEQVSNVYSSLSDAELEKFAELVDEYARLLLNVKAAIGQRNDKKNAYILAMTDVDAKGASLRKAQSSGKDASSKEQAVTNAEAMRDATKADFERVTDRLLREFDVFKVRSQQEWKNLLASYVEFQLEHNRRIEHIWENVSPHLQAQEIAPYSPYESPFDSHRSYPTDPPPPLPVAAPVINHNSTGYGSGSGYHSFGAASPSSGNPFSASAPAADDEDEGDFAGV